MRRNSVVLTNAANLHGTQGKLQSAAVAAVLISAVCLGGASSAGITANAVLEVAGLIATTAVLLRRWPTALTRAERHLLVLAALFAGLYVAQIVPLPPAIWTLLPGRKIVVAGLGVLGIAPPWMPVSLTPANTLHSSVALLAPIAMMLMIMRFQRPVARVAIATLMGLMLISVLLGVAQFSGTGAYLYAISNFGSATGFFSNANHFGTLMCVSIPLATGLVAGWRSEAEGKAAASRAIAIAVLLATALIAMLGIAMTKSVAGLLLSTVAIIGSTAIVVPGLSRGLRVSLFGGVVLVFVTAGAVIFAAAPNDFFIDGLNDQMFSRPMMWGITGRAIRIFEPFGSGFGSFQQVFHLFENPAHVTEVFANHAHNDLLEFVLESGIPGIALIVAFLVWFLRQSARIWWLDRRRDPLAQAAAIAVTIVLLHSLVDYPLRTGAIATIFGLGLALMARGRGGGGDEQQPSNIPAAGRHLSA